MRQEIQLAGFGGQGIILAGFVLGRAASIYDGKEAVFTQSYGPEARGGACAAEVVISNAPIDYPLVTRPDLVVCMSQEAYSKYGVALADGGELIIDSDLVEAGSNGIKRLPAMRLATDLGNRMAANVVMLGFLASVTDVVSRDALEKSVRETVKPRLLELNMSALKTGFEYGLSETSTNQQKAAT